MTLIIDLLPKLRTPENVIRYLSKSPISKDPLTGNMVNGSKHCCDVAKCTVTIFTAHCEGN